MVGRLVVAMGFPPRREISLLLLVWLWRDAVAFAMAKSVDDSEELDDDFSVASVECLPSEDWDEVSSVSMFDSSTIVWSSS